MSQNGSNNEIQEEATLETINKTVDDLFKYLKENVVTHEDLINELKNFSTKDDLFKVKKDLIDVIEKTAGHLKDDYVGLIRKEDEKVDALIGALQEGESLTQTDSSLLAKLGPFPQPII